MALSKDQNTKKTSRAKPTGRAKTTNRAKPILFFCFSLFFFSIAQAGQGTKIRFATNWVAEAEHGGFYQAIFDQEYKKCGYHVEIIPGGAQINNRALLLAGKVDLHLGDNMLEALQAREAGIPLTVIAGFFQKAPQAFLTHPGQNLDHWSDLVDAPIYLSDSDFYSYFRWLMHAYGFQEKNRLPYHFNIAPFLTHKNHVQQSYVTAEPFLIEGEGGFQPNIFLLADYGFDSYSATIEVMENTIKTNPELVQCFVTASARGWKNYLYGDPQGAHGMILSHNQEISLAQLNYSREKLKQFGIVDSGDSLTHGIGIMTHRRQQSFFHKMREAKLLKADLAYRKAYDLQFLAGLAKAK